MALGLSGLATFHDGPFLVLYTQQRFQKLRSGSTEVDDLRLYRRSLLFGWTARGPALDDCVTSV